jgi:hypothetical protein
MVEKLRNPKSTGFLILYAVSLARNIQETCVWIISTELTASG